MRNFLHPLAAAFVLLLAALPPLLAEPVLELDFRTFDEANRTVTATKARPGTPTALPVSAENSIVDPAAATGIASGNPALTTGFYEAFAGEGGGGFLTSSKLATDPTASYAKYLDSEGFSSGTLVVIFQPRFSGALTGETTSQRSSIFASNFQGTARQAVQLYIGRDLSMNFGLGKIEPPVQRVSMPQPEWNPGKWYFIAASWSPGSMPSLYCREIGGAATFVQAEAPLENAPEPGFRNLVIGNAGSNTEAGGNVPMNGKLAYFYLADDNVATEADFDALYKTIVQPK